MSRILSVLIVALLGVGCGSPNPELKRKIAALEAELVDVQVKHKSQLITATKQVEKVGVVIAQYRDWEDLDKLVLAKIQSYAICITAWANCGHSRIKLIADIYKLTQELKLSSSSKSAYWSVVSPLIVMLLFIAVIAASPFYLLSRYLYITLYMRPASGLNDKEASIQHQVDEANERINEAWSKIRASQAALDARIEELGEKETNACIAQEEAERLHRAAIEIYNKVRDDQDLSMKHQDQIEEMAGLFADLT